MTEYRRPRGKPYKKPEKYLVDAKSLKNKILRLLTKRDHSAKEMKTKLKRYYEFSDEDFTSALAYVKELGYLPDEAKMAQSLINKWRREGRGKNYVSMKLKTRGIEIGTLDSVVLKDDENEIASARYFLEKKLRGQDLKELDFKEKQKLMRQMTSRGFSVSVVRDLIK